MLEYVLDYLKANDVEYKRKIKLSGISPVKIGGYAEVVILPQNIDELIQITEFCRRENIKVKIVGTMSNILPDDDGYDGLLIKTDRIAGVEACGCEIVAECGVPLIRLARISSECGLSGFEELSGIPGRVGGAVYMNAGAYEREISDIITECRVYDSKIREVISLKAEDIGFSYRESKFSTQEWILLTAKFRLTESASDNILCRMKDFKRKRELTQPTSMPSLGSVFKRPKRGVSAGAIIDKCGLRGYSVGGAGISEKHAGFIVNLGGAASSDFKKLVSLAETEVYQKFGIRLEREIEFL